MTHFDLPVPDVDPLLLLMSQFRADPRPDKLDLGIGVYRDAKGRTPVMRAVKAAEQRLVDEQAGKAYIGSAGDAGFVGLMQDLVLGAAVPSARIGGIQTPGGTGALRIAAEVLVAAGIRRLLIGAPYWTNHEAIARKAGLEVVEYPYLDEATGQFSLDNLLKALAAMGPSDAVLLQASCHNPTGQDPDLEQWNFVTNELAKRGITPLLDLAYQGLGDGFDADVGPVRQIAARLPHVLITSSSSKNFGLYRDRVGCLHFIAPDVAGVEKIRASALSCARANWSMPPDHGAAVVRLVLETPELRAEWLTEVEEVRERITAGRLALSMQEGAIDYTAVANGRGMFATLPLSPDVCEALRREQGIYIAPAGRVNLAGLDAKSAFRLARAIDACMASVLA
jgi:aromatic-amino-acid transaminase